jgi:hypothetical protein
LSAREETRTKEEKREQQMNPRFQIKIALSILPGCEERRTEDTKSNRTLKLGKHQNWIN